MRYWWWLAVAGCSFHRGEAVGDGPLVTDSSPSEALLGDAPSIDGSSIDASTPDAFVCSTSGLVCVGGTTQAVTCGGICWVSCTAQGTELAASTACTNWGGRLAPLQTQADQDCVHIMIFPANASWIGFEQDVTATTLGGKWSWNSDAITPGYIHWSGGQPNDLDGTEDGQEQCAYMSTPSGTWQDTACTGLLFNFSCRHN